MIQTEICVVGGGPAGSAIAHKLALLGHSVCLIEKSPFPRAHIRESLPPTILSVLDLLGVRECVEAANFLRPHRSLIRWSSPEAHWTESADESGFNVDRGRLDHILLSAAQTAGVQILQPAQATRPVSRGHQQWVVPVRWQGESIEVQARFLINATGKHRSLSRTNPHSPSTLALYGYWRDVPWQGVESRVEAGTDEWFWGAPLPDGRFNAAVFLDAKRHSATKPRDREQWYRSLLANTALFQGCLAGNLDTPVQICDASCYYPKTAIGLDWITVGDAAFALDPISSQGVQMAMMSAFQGAISVHTLLTMPEQAEAAIDFYQHKLHETVARSQRTAAQIYATQAVHPISPFWQQRSQGLDEPPSISWEQNTHLFEIYAPIRLSKATNLRSTPVIQGDVVRFVTALHHPALENPVAYLGSVAIAPLLESLDGHIGKGQTIIDLMQCWSHWHNRSTCWQLLQWFWSRHIIVSDTSNTLGIRENLAHSGGQG